MIFISFVLNGNIRLAEMWLAAVAIMAIAIIAASILDLYWGIRASKKLGNFKTSSYGLRRTATKDQGYLALYFCAVLIDACLSFVMKIPAASMLIAISEIAIEAWSVHEKMRTIRKGDPDPLAIARAISNTYGLKEASRIVELLDEQMKKAEDNNGSDSFQNGNIQSGYFQNGNDHMEDKDLNDPQ